ncbi:MAG TPA: cytochrome P450 [Solirubrobacteraceae bacterium]|jgi:cytochrome P450|nr:cytochrome P450 [Solirubrobacteraceae bacterium]
MARPAADLLDHDLFADHEPWEVFEALQREAPVFFHEEPGGRGFWVITKFDDVRAVLRDYATFSSEVGGAARVEDLPEDVLAARRNFLEFDPPKHGRYRRLFSADFTPSSVGRYGDWLRELIAARLDAALAKGSFDLVEELAAPVPIRVLGRILGLPDEELPELIRLGDRLLVDTEPDYVGELAYAGEQDEYRYKPFGSPWADELCAIGRAHYAERRECPRDDVLSSIANGEIDGRALDERELDNMFALMIVAGNETTRQAIALSTLTLGRCPADYARLRADPELLPSAVEELLRFCPPVWFFRRTTTAACEIRGVEIAAGEKVTVWFAAANRDGDHYEDPHTFDLARNPTDHLTFGRGGPHVCLGQHLAKLELRIYIEELARRVESFELLDADPPRLRSNFSNGLKRLEIAAVAA